VKTDGTEQALVSVKNVTLNFVVQLVQTENLASLVQTKIERDRLVEYVSVETDSTNLNSVANPVMSTVLLVITHHINAQLVKVDMNFSHCQARGTLLQLQQRLEHVNALEAI
jgi:hypothetical protein